MDKIPVGITDVGGAGDVSFVKGSARAHTTSHDYTVETGSETNPVALIGAELLTDLPAPVKSSEVLRPSDSLPIKSTQKERRAASDVLKKSFGVTTSTSLYTGPGGPPALGGREYQTAQAKRSEDPQAGRTSDVPSSISTTSAAAKPKPPKTPRPLGTPTFVRFTDEDIAAPREKALAELLKETVSAEKQLATFQTEYPEQQLSLAERGAFKERQVKTGVLKEREAELARLKEQHKSDRGVVLERRIKGLQLTVEKLGAKCQQIKDKEAEIADAEAQLRTPSADKRAIQSKIDAAKKEIGDLSQEVLSESAEAQEASDKVERLSASLSGLRFRSSPREYVKLKLALREWTARKESAMSAPLTAWEREERRLKDAVSEAGSSGKRRDAEAELLEFRQRGPRLHFMAKMQRANYDSFLSTQPQRTTEAIQKKLEATGSEVLYRAQVSGDQYKLSTLVLEQSKLRMQEAELESEELALYNQASDIGKSTALSPAQKHQEIDQLFQQHWKKFKAVKRALADIGRERATMAAATGRDLNPVQMEMMFAGTEGVKEEWRPERAGESLLRGVVHKKRLETIVKGRVDHALKLTRLLPDLYQSAKVEEARSMKSLEGDRLAVLYEAYPGLATATYLAEQWNRPTILTEFLKAELEASEKDIPRLEKQLAQRDTAPLTNQELGAVRQKLAEARSKLGMIKTRIDKGLPT